MVGSHQHPEDDRQKGNRARYPVIDLPNIKAPAMRGYYIGTSMDIYNYPIYLIVFIKLLAERVGFEPTKGY